MKRVSPGARTTLAVIVGYVSAAVPMAVAYLSTLDSLGEIDWLKVLVGALVALAPAGATGTTYRAPSPVQKPERPAVARPAPRASPDIDVGEFVFGRQSRSVLDNARPELRAVHERALALSEIDFACYESRRTVEKQRENIEKGVSWTMQSRHLEWPLAGAVDHVPIVKGRECWDWWAFEKTTAAIKQAASELDIACTHGIDWKGKKRDGPHTELDRSVYPMTAIPA